MRSNIPIGSDGVDAKNGKPAATNGKAAGISTANGMNGNGHYVETNGKAPMVNGSNGVAHTNGHTETGISKSKFLLIILLIFFIINLVTFNAIAIPIADLLICL